jgi:putative transcriptional regulator
MSPPRHHPDEDVLLSYGVGTLGPGAALTVEVHAERCPECARTLRFLETVAGALMQTVDAEPVAPGAIETALARLKHAADTQTRSGDAPSDLPAALHGRVIGRWWWIAPGLKAARLRGASGRGECLYLLRARPGARIPRHGHLGTERFSVLQGTVLVDGEAYDARDYGETGAGQSHAMTIGRNGQCLCLFSTDGDLVFEGAARWWIGLLRLANNMAHRHPRGDLISRSART